jgi:hypothetical protein
MLAVSTWPADGSTLRREAYPGSFDRYLSPARTLRQSVEWGRSA